MNLASFATTLVTTLGRRTAAAVPQPGMQRGGQPHGKAASILAFDGVTVAGLAVDGARHLHVHRAGWLRVLGARAWLTRERSLADVVLEPGEAVHLTPGDGWLIDAFDARLRHLELAWTPDCALASQGRQVPFARKHGEWPTTLAGGCA